MARRLWLAPVAVLLFLYLTALAILLGAELNAEIDRLWPRPETAEARAGSYPDQDPPAIEEEHRWPASPEGTMPQQQSGHPSS